MIHIIITEVFGFLSGRVLANNSIVTDEEIGSKDNQALLCYTNLTECCHSTHQRPVLGQWYDPTGNVVQKMYDAISNNLSVYRNRGPSVVRLFRVMNKTLPSGIFKCEVNDANGSLQSVHIGVYPKSEG